MRIVIDLQPCQTDSRNRGIGRYSLALTKAIAKQKGDHELRFTLNEIFGDRITQVRDEFAGLIEPAMFSYYRYPDFHKALDFVNNYQRPLAEVLVRNHLAQLCPDIVHISSVFEGWYSRAATPAHLSRLPGTIWSATLYDLIPLLFRDHYIPANNVQQFYYQKLKVLKECDLLLAISEASRQDAIKYLQIAPEKIVTISGAVDPTFKPITISHDETQSLLQRYGLKEKFILYTGGVDFRKNLTGTIEGYAGLPLEIRQQCQLVIVCDIDPINKAALLRYAAQLGLLDGEVVFTGFVPDEELRRFYNLCSLFIFPSLYEGFGLPILEAMACGAPVLGGDNSSIAEIIGRKDALFNSEKPESITQALYLGLTDEAFRSVLKAWSSERVKAFSWDHSAAVALAAFEEVRARKQPRDVTVAAQYVARRKMAYFSPLIGQDSELAEYNAGVLPELAKYFDVELYTDHPCVADEYMSRNFRTFTYQDFVGRHSDYDVVLYQMGKTLHYASIYDMLQRYPGIVVLRDFYLGELIQQIAQTNSERRDMLQGELEYSHGSGVRRMAEGIQNTDEIIREYPCNLRVLNAVTGVISHSEEMLPLIQRFYPQGIATSLDYIDIHQHPSQIAAQYALCIDTYTRKSFARQQAVLAAEVGEIFAHFTVPTEDMTKAAECAVANIPGFYQPRILIDTSHIHQSGYQGGIQRLVRSTTRQLCRKTNVHWQARPVRLAEGKLYSHEAIVDCADAPMVETITPQWHDILLMLDAPWAFYDDYRKIFPQIRYKQGSIYVVIYDLLCVLYPQYFESHVSQWFANWIASCVQESDGLICISKTVADELIQYMQTQQLPYRKNLKIGYFHLGADISDPTESAVHPQVREWCSRRDEQVFLVVGTIAQRKGHHHALDAFERLWAAGSDMKLIIAGKAWLCDDVVQRILEHREYGRKLLWLNNPSDAEILYCYRHASALLFPSEAEGFGLPLVEAAQHGLPIICSDIPVFREVAGVYATYFPPTDPDQLANILRTWHSESSCPDTSEMPRLSWEQSVDQLIDIVVNNQWYTTLS